MASQRWILAVCAAAAAACGGGGGGGGGRIANPAASTTFSYPDPTSALPPMLASDAVSTAASLDGTLTPDGALLLQETLFAAASDALGDMGGPFAVAGSDALGQMRPSELIPSEAVPMMRQARAAALSAPGGGTFATSCYTATASTVTFRGCSITETSTDGTSFTVTVDGHVTGAPGTATWELSIGLVMASPDGRISARYDDLGSVTVTATTMKARQDTILQASANFGGQSDAMALGQTADLDVVLDPPAACATRIVDGTLEAKRVWIRRPAGATHTDLPDVGVKYSWDGCDVGTFQLATR
jgi:hypothetical protein